MTSGEDGKQQARETRLEQERQRLAAAAQRKRLGIFGGVLALAVIVIVVIVVSVSGGGSKKATVNQSAANSSGILTDSGAEDQYEIGLQNGTNLSRIDNQIHATIGGIQQHGSTLGDPNAKVKVIYYGDLQCSYCQVFTIFDLPAFISAYVRTGKASLVYRSYPAATRSTTVFEQQQAAAYGAGLQNKAWDFIERFYRQQGVENSGYSNAAFWSGIAKQISGLNFNTWNNDLRTDPNLTAQVTAEGTQSAQYGIAGTPTLVFIGPKGTKVPALDVAQWADSISTNEATASPVLKEMAAAYHAVL